MVVFGVCVVKESGSASWRACWGSGYVTSEELLMVCGRSGLVVFSNRVLWFMTVLQEREGVQYNGVH